MTSKDQEQLNLSDKQAAETLSTQLGLNSDLLSSWQPRMDLKNPLPLVVADQLTAWLDSKASWVYRGLQPVHSYHLHDALSSPESYRSADFNLRVYRELIDKQVVARPDAGLPKRRQSGFSPDVLFDSCFETGNLGYAFRTSSTDFALFLRIDTNTRGHTQWFHFRATASESVAVSFAVLNMSKAKSIFGRGGLPVWSTAPGQWQPVAAAAYTPLTLTEQAQWLPPQGYRPVNALRFSHKLAKDTPTAFAYAVPYSYGDLQRSLAVPHPQCTVRSLCQSESGLDVPLLTFRGSGGPTAPVVFVCARVHPGEAASSHMCAGLIDWLQRGCAEVKELLAVVEVRVVPMVNVDGVVAGNFRTGLAGDDLNRRYLKPSAALHPTVCSIKRLVSSTLKSEKRQVVAFLDLHGHSTKPDIFTYGPELSTGDRLHSVARYFAQLLASKVPYFRLADCSWVVPASKKRTARAVMLQGFGVKCTFTVEASTAARTADDGELTHMSVQDYRVMGAALLQSLGVLTPYLVSPGKSTRQLAALLITQAADDRGAEEGGSDSESAEEDFGVNDKQLLRQAIEQAPLASDFKNQGIKHFVKKKAQKRVWRDVSQAAVAGRQASKVGEHSVSALQQSGLARRAPLMSKHLFTEAAAGVFAKKQSLFRHQESRRATPLTLKSLEPATRAERKPQQPARVVAKTAMQQKLTWLSKKSVAAMAVSRSPKQCHSLDSSSVQAGPPQQHRSLRPRAAEALAKKSVPGSLSQVYKKRLLHKMDSSDAAPARASRFRVGRSEDLSQGAQQGSREPIHNYYAGWKKDSLEHDVLFSQIAIRFPQPGQEVGLQVTRKVLLGNDFSRLIEGAGLPRPAPVLPSIYRYLPLQAKQSRARE